MSRVALDEWLKRDDAEFVDALVRELRSYFESIAIEEIAGFAVVLEDGANYRGEYLSIVHTPDKAEDNYTRFCADEWADGPDTAFPDSGRLLLDRHEAFAKLHVKDPTDYMMDDDQIANLAHLENSVLTALARVRDQFSPETFAVVWNPHGPTDITPKSVRQLNSKATCKAFLAEFGDNWPDFE